MKKINTYIHYLLYEEGKAVLPQLGTLSAHYQPARADIGRDRFTPPAHRLQFSEQLEDPGPTVRQIASLASLPEKEVQRALEEYASQLADALENKGEAILEGLGKLHKGKAEQIRFDPDPNFNSQGNAFGLETFHLTKRSPAPIAQEEEIITQPPAGEQTVAAKPPKERKEKKHPSGILTVLISLLLLAFCAYLAYALFFDPPSHINRYLKPLSSQEKEMIAPTGDQADRTKDVLALPPADTLGVAEDSTEASSGSIAAPVPDSIVPQENGADSVESLTAGREEKYFIVAGLFKTDKGVARSIQQLNTKGYPAKVFRTNARGIHYVCFAGYPDRASAEEALQKIRESEDPQAWIWPENF